MAKNKDTEYLYITAVIRAKELRLITSAQLDRMIEANSDSEALRVLEECGFDDMSDTLSAEKKLNDYFSEILAEIAKYIPNEGLVDIFRLKYDYHNAKVLIKAEASNIDGMRIMSTSGRFAPVDLHDAFIQGIQGPMTDIFSAALYEGKDVLARTKDAQQADFVLDRAYYNELRQIADESGSSFITGYCQLSVDVVNLKTAVRALRMEMDYYALEAALIEGGNVETDNLVAIVKSGEGISALFSAGALSEAGEAGERAVKGESLTEFERLCDNALVKYLKGAGMVSFGQAPVIAFIAAVEAEITAVRIVMNSRKCNLEPQTIRERLRESYV